MPRTTITIYADDDFEVIADAKRRVRIAERKLDLAELEAQEPTEDPRVGDDVPDVSAAIQAARNEVQRLRDEFDACVDRASARAEAWELQHIGFEDWAKLLGEHPARTVTEGEGDEAREVTHPDDDAWARALNTAPFNTETFGRALLLFVDTDDPDNRTVKALGDADPGTVLAKRVKRLSRGQYETLWTAAHQLNTGGVADPKSLRYSTEPRSTES